MTEIATKYRVPQQPIPDGDRLYLLYVPLSWARGKFLDGNLKKHDIGVLHQLIEQYSFRDPMTYDQAANDGQGGLTAGNGRLETLCNMYDGGFDAPGKILEVDSDWLIPMIFGADSSTAEEAKAYAIDHNIAPLKGGEFSSYQILSGLFDPSIFDELETMFQSGSETISVDGDDLDSALQALESVQQGSLEVEEFPEEEMERPPGITQGRAIGVVFDDDEWEDWLSVKEQLKVKNDKTAILRLMAIANDHLEVEG